MVQQLLADPTSHDILRSEAEFHDQWASDTPLDQILVRESFEAPTAVENQFILRKMGPLKGKRLLDIGAGLGESSVYFALQGAEVTMVDVSPEMVHTAQESGRRFGVHIRGKVSPGEVLDVEPDYYDLVYIANTIHHVHDREALFTQIKRALKPGGRFFSIDPMAYNPAINVYRRMATKVRTPDEAPLTLADLAMVRRHFSNTGHREFWFTTLALFFKYYLIDRVHPNEDRYWKRILRETDARLWWWLPLRAFDNVIARLPGVRLLCWNIVMWGQKQA